VAIRCAAIGGQQPLWQAGKVVLSTNPIQTRLDDDTTAFSPSPSLATP
jgi:hypothetical protein